MSDNNITTKRQNLFNIVNDSSATKKTSIVFMLLPEWAMHFPSYTMARLTAISKANGFSASCIDLNVKAYRDYQKNWSKEIDFDPWNASKDWKWRDFYESELHHHLEPLLQTYLEKIGEIKPTAVGFTLYYCNKGATNWMIKEIRKRYPEMVILVGGPECNMSEWKPEPYYDYVVSGEGEQAIIEILNEIEANNGRPQAQKWIKQMDGGRLNLDSLPLPDYSSFDFSEYINPHGVNSEFSRGCIAKCVYCMETHYWKYRYRTANSALSEFQYLNELHGTNFVHFVDSLVNGNLEELRNFALGVAKDKMNIKWMGYARADKRMDYDYFKDLAAGGCFSLNYGFESGSNKILDHMNKKSTREDIEQNLIDSTAHGVWVDSNWIMGFPTETPQDFYETLILLFRNRGAQWRSIAAGGSYGLAADTIAAQNIQQWDISPSWYEDNWITNDFKNSKIHRLARLKLFNILVEVMNNKKLFTKNPFVAGCRSVSQYYTLEADIKEVKTPQFEIFDMDIVNPRINPLADSLINEMWPFFRLLWKSIGAFKGEIIFDPELDFKEFGPFVCGDFTGKFKFDIDANGIWSADFYLKFNQSKEAWRDGADQVNATSVGASRARVFAITNSNGENVWTSARHEQNLKKLEENSNLNFSFETSQQLNGRWD